MGRIKGGRPVRLLGRVDEKWQLKWRRENTVGWPFRRQSQQGSWLTGCRREEEDESGSWLKQSVKPDARLYLLSIGPSWVWCFLWLHHLHILEAGLGSRIVCPSSLERSAMAFCTPAFCKHNCQQHPLFSSAFSIQLSSFSQCISLVLLCSLCF